MTNIMTDADRKRYASIISGFREDWQKTDGFAANDHRGKSRPLHPSAKLTEEQVRAIRCDTTDTKHLAKTYGVSVNTINCIRRGQTYRCVG